MTPKVSLEELECQPRCHTPDVPSTSPAELAEVFDLLGPLYRQTVRQLEHTSAVPVGVRAVLDLLRVRQSLTVPRIADVLGLSRQFVQRCVNEAEDGGWVELRTNPAHQRSSLVVITEAGRDLVTGIRAGEAESLASVAATISGEDVAACVRVLTQLLDLVREGPP
jgi:DNA-binding MarR family transcriptional regulator